MGIASERSTSGGNSVARCGVGGHSSWPREVAFQRACDDVHIGGVNIAIPQPRSVSFLLAQTRSEIRLWGNFGSLDLLLLQWGCIRTLLHVQAIANSFPLT